MNTVAFLVGLIVSLGYYFYSVRRSRKNAERTAYGRRERI
jgi:O-antigen/teichoic acid export membrane protein